MSVVRDKMAADTSLEERTRIPIDKQMEVLIFYEEMTYFRMGLTYTDKTKTGNETSVITSTG